MNLSDLKIPIAPQEYQLSMLPFYKEWFLYRSSLVDEITCEEFLEHWFNIKTYNNSNQITLESVDSIDRIFLSAFDEVFSSLKLPINWATIRIMNTETIIKYDTYTLLIRNHSNIVKIYYNEPRVRITTRKIYLNCSMIHRVSYRLYQFVNDFNNTLLTKTDLIKNTLFNIALELEIFYVKRATLANKNLLSPTLNNS